MRTALLAWDYPPAPSGLSTAAREIAESLAGQGCDVTVFTLDRRGEEHAGGVRIVGCAIDPASVAGWLRRRAAIGHLAAPDAFRRAVASAHARAPFDVVEATNWYGPGALVTGAALVTRNSTPAAMSRGDAQGLRDRIDNRGADAIERRQVRRSSGIISNTADHGARMAALYGIGPDVPNAAIGLSLSPAFLERAARSRGLTSPSDHVRILFVGRTEHRKGFDLLMDALARLDGQAEAGELPQFELTLMGVADHEVPDSLPATARARIRALGRRPAEELQDAYSRCDIVAAPSRYESFGLVYQEAMAHGRPLAALALDPSASAFVGAGGAGVLAPEPTGAALADALRALVASPERRAVHAANAVASANRFTRETLGTETLGLYRMAKARFQGR